MSRPVLAKVIDAGLRSTLKSHVQISVDSVIRQTLILRVFFVLNIRE